MFKSLNLKVAKQLVSLLIFGGLIFSAPLSSQVSKPELKELEKSTGLKGKKLRAHLKLMRDVPPYDDEEIQAYVNKVGNRILAQSEHAHLPYRFIVRDTDVVNAFVTGTHYVYVERGLLSLLNSEAELAAVMAHEIGHNVARHTKKLQARNRRNTFLATLASIAVGNRGVGNAIMTQSNVTLSEYRRSAELEADSFAPLPHHGLLTTHPRSDRRLREAIEDAGVLPPGEGYIGREAYREAISGMVYGPNYRRSAPPGLKRYSNESLGITFMYPKSWSFSLKGSKIILKDPAKTAQLKITIEKTPNTKASSEEALKVKYPEGLVNLQKIHPQSQRDLGTIAARPAQRVALSMVARNTFHFLGIAKNNEITAEQDKTFVNIIRSFSRMTPKDRVSDHVTEIFYERLKPGESFLSLAKQSKLDPASAEVELRVINGYYPKGEPEPGTWIKKLRKVKITQN